MNIGFIGYSGKPFDKVKAQKIIDEILMKEGIGEYFTAGTDKSRDVSIISGATDLGIPGMVYHTAEKYNFKTIGVMCKRGYDRDNTLYPCDEIYAVGENWGDESELFISKIDRLYKIGGGEQSDKEKKMAEAAGIQVFEYKL